MTPDLHPSDTTVTLSEQSTPRLLLMVYECNPYTGSEAYMGWGRVLQAAREFEVDVICSEESYDAVQKFLGINALPNVHFHSPEPDSVFSVLRRIPRLFAYNYVAYRHWQRLALRLATRLHRTHRFALVHQVNVCTFREPGDTWSLGIPYLWGPVGGTQNFPDAFLRGLPLVERFKERARTAANRRALSKPRIRRAAQATGALLAANSTNQRDYQRAFNRPAELLLETGLYEILPPDPAKFLADGPLQLLWSGEFTTRKALPLLLRALALLKTSLDFRLTVLGRGPLEASWKGVTAKLGLSESVLFAGQLPLADAVAQLDRAQIFVFTSLRDTSGNVVLEALARGVPVICFDHQGVGDIVTSDCGIKIPVTTPDQAVQQIAQALRALDADRGRLVQLSAGALARATDYLWSENGDRVNAIYRSLLQAPKVTQ